jgi:hypothetical protein
LRCSTSAWYQSQSLSQERNSDFVGELAVRGVGRPLPLLRPLARILHRQCGGDHQHLAQAALVAGGDDHPPEARVERHLRQFLAGRRQRVSAVTAPSSSSNW